MAVNGRSPRVQFSPTRQQSKHKQIDIVKLFSLFDLCILCRYQKQTHPGSVEWDFSDGGSSSSEETSFRMRERKPSDKEVEITLSHAKIWEQGSTVDGKLLERLYNSKYFKTNKNKFLNSSISEVFPDLFHLHWTTRIRIMMNQMTLETGQTPTTPTQLERDVMWTQVSMRTLFKDQQMLSCKIVGKGSEEGLSVERQGLSAIIVFLSSTH